MIRLEDTRLRIGVVGPLLGGTPGWVTSQGEVLVERFAGDGHVVRSTSRVTGRAGRLADTIRSIRSWRGEVDVVVLMVFSGPAFAMTDAASLVARRLRVPLAMALHGGNLAEFAAHRRRWVQRVLARADALIAPSRFLADAFSPAWVIPNVLPELSYGYRDPTPLRPRLLWLRTFHDNYDPHMALDVIGRLGKEVPGARLTMGGQDRGLLAAVRAEAETRGLGDAVRFVGFLDDDGKRRELLDNDVFINTNVVDNAPVTLIEVAAAGLPIVATRVGGIPAMLDHGTNALLVEARDAEAMAAAVRRLLDDPKQAQLLSRAGKRLAESSRWERVRPLWNALFAELVSRSRGGL